MKDLELFMIYRGENMEIIEAKSISYSGAYYGEIRVSKKLKEAYDIVKRMEKDKVVYGVNIGFNKIISLRTGYLTTNYYTADALQKQLEKMGLTIERNDCYNWFYIKEENDVDKYFRKDNKEKENVEINRFEPRVGTGNKPWKKGEPLGENEKRIKEVEKKINKN